MINITIIAAIPKKCMDAFSEFCFGENVRKYDGEPSWRLKGGRALISRNLIPNVPQECTLEYADQVTPFYMVYKFQTSEYPNNEYFSSLCELFPELNLYYYEVKNGTCLTALVHEEGSDRGYHVRDKRGVSNYRIELYCPALTYILARTTCDVDEFVDIIDKCKAEYQDSGSAPTDITGLTYLEAAFESKHGPEYTERRALLTESLNEINNTVRANAFGLSINSFITLLLRDDSFEVLKIATSVKLRDSNANLGITPLMFAIKIGKIAEYRLLRTAYPGWLLQLDENGRSVLHYCVLAHNTNLFEELWRDLIGVKANIELMFTGVAELAEIHTFTIDWKKLNTIANTYWLGGIPHLC